MKREWREDFLAMRGKLLVICVLVACGGDDALPAANAPDASVPASDAGAPPPVPPNPPPPNTSVIPRPFMLAATGAQILVTGDGAGYQLTQANLADDVDVVAIHQEFYGIPWDYFAANLDLPAAWTDPIRKIAADARATKKPIFLSLNPLNATRSELAPKATVDGDGKLVVTDHWAPVCYDFQNAPDALIARTAYERYVDFMFDTFEPTWMNIAIEENLFFQSCFPQRPGLVQLSNEVYDGIKAKHPKAIVFPSFQIDHLYGYTPEGCPSGERDACFKANYAMLDGIRRDRFAISTYPALIGLPSDQIPSDWFSRAAVKEGERILVAETGWNSTGLNILGTDEQCQAPFKDGSVADEEMYLRHVLSDAEVMDLFTWTLDRDLVDARLMTDCPCSFDARWCGFLDAVRGPAPDGGVADTRATAELALKAFGTMGLRSYDGTPKAGPLDAWRDARSRPIKQQ